MNKSISKMAIAVMVLVALIAFAMPASADGDPGAGCDCDTELYGTINGNVYFEQQGWMEKPMTKTFTVPLGTIEEARIYSGVWQGSPGKGGYFDMKIENSGPDFTTDTYQACDPCPGSPCGSCQDERCDILNNAINMPHNQNLDLVNMHGYTVGCGVQFYSFNATPYIKPGDNTITVTTTNCPTCPNGQWDGRIYLIALLVVYDDGSAETTYWVNEGALYLEKGSGCDGPEDHLYASKYFNGTHVTPATGVKLWSLGWPHVINATVPPAYTKLNGNSLGVPDISEGYAGGYNEVMVRWNDISTGYLDPTSNFLEYYDPDPLYERAFVEVLLVETSNQSDLVVTDIEFPAMMQPNTPYTITATVKNEGSIAAEASQARLNVNGAVEPVPIIPSGGVYPVEFTGVNLAEGCYEFIVEADCNHVVAESNENNNEGTEDYQVGYYIVVDGNAGFNTIVSMGYATSSGGTYYIENHDLENCAGPGIDIQNTNVPFEINNCNIHNCDDCGIFCRNVMNGEITGNTVESNHMKGIKLQKCSYIVVEDNTVQNNSEYGIDVYMEVMPTVDSEFITITCNTLIENEYGIELLGDNCIVCGNSIQNSYVYGMYMFGSDNEVYNNTIENSGNYGMKLDHSATTPCLNNDLYQNDFINNGGAGAQAFDSGTTNTWNSPTPVNYCYSGGTYNNYVGNYWSDHRDPTDPDGIMDSPYAIDAGTAQDSYPLSVEWRLCGDVNRDGYVNGVDVGLLIQKVYNPPPPSAFVNEWAGNVNCDTYVNGVDVGLLKQNVYNPPPPSNFKCCKC